MINSQLTVDELTCQKCHQLKNDNEDLKAEIDFLKRFIQNQNQKIYELECLSNPYSCDGDAICNFDG